MESRDKLIHHTLSEGVEAVLRQMILLGELSPGEHINELQLAEFLKVSRGPIREALRSLQAEGLVVYRRRRGTYVASLTAREVEEVYSLRSMLEVWAVRLALPAVTDSYLGRLEHMVQRFQDAVDSLDMAALIQCDMDFHHAIVRLSGHGRLFDMYCSLDTQLGAMVVEIQNKAPERIRQVARMHQSLVDALRSRDENIITTAVKHHYQSAQNVLCTPGENHSA